MAGSLPSGSKRSTSVRHISLGMRKNQSVPGYQTKIFDTSGCQRNCTQTFVPVSWTAEMRACGELLAAAGLTTAPRCQNKEA